MPDGVLQDVGLLQRTLGKAIEMPAEGQVPLPRSIAQASAGLSAYKGDLEQFLEKMRELRVPEAVYRPCLLSMDRLRICMFFSGLINMRPSESPPIELAQFLYYLFSIGRINPEAREFLDYYEKVIGKVVVNKVIEEANAKLQAIRELMAKGRQAEALSQAEMMAKMVEESLQRASSILPAELVKRGLSRAMIESGDEILKRASSAISEASTPREISERIKGAVASEIRAVHESLSKRPEMQGGAEVKGLSKVSAVNVEPNKRGGS